VTSVTFPHAITGRTADTIYSDDNDPNTGMADGGHQERWLPMLQDVVAATAYIAEYAAAIDTADENAAAALASQNAAAQSASAAATSESQAAASAASAANAQTTTQTAAVAAATDASAANLSALNAATSASAAAASQTAAQTAAATAISAPGTQATSTTPLTFATGLQNLTIQAGKVMVIGMSVKIADSTNGARWMHGDITAYNSSTGQLTVNIDTARGTGTASAWTISLSAPGSLLPYVRGDGSIVTVSLW
jgi:hypothetical protein